MRITISNNTMTQKGIKILLKNHSNWEGGMPVYTIRVPQEWKAGWKMIRYRGKWYELQGRFDEEGPFIDLKKPLRRSI